MTVSSETSRISYTGAGTTGPFSAPFYFLEDDDLVIIKTEIATGVETILALTTDYTVAGAGNPAGGSVTTVAAVPATHRLTILRDPDLLQNTDYPTNDPFPAESHERALDKLTMVTQRLRDLIGRAVRLSDGLVGSVNLTMPSPNPGKAFKWNALGDGIENSAYNPDEMVALASAQAASAEVARIAAEAARAAAEAVFDAFDDRYLGAKTSAPTLDNDGNALQDGALYYDTTLNFLRVYDLDTTTWISLPATALASLTDVLLTSIATGDVLQWNGSKWVNSKIGSSAFALTADITPAQITANTNDYAPTGLSTANTLRLSTDASRDLTGLTGGSDGRLMIVHNVGSNALVLKNESASSTAANRFALGGADVTLAANQSVTLQYDATSSRWRRLDSAGGSNAGTTGGVRQTAQTGPVTTAGLPSFMPATSSGSSVSSQNITASSPLVVSAAGGEADRSGTTNANLSWTGLTVTNGVVNFGYVDIAADGTLTTGVTTQAPIYQYGGTPATTNGLTTFNIGEMRGYTGNGSTAPRSYRVFLWEGTGNGTNVASIVAYAYNGIYDSGWTNTLPGASTAVSRNHNIGAAADQYVGTFDIKCITAEHSYSVGDVLTGGGLYTAANVPGPNLFRFQRNSCSLATSAASPPWFIFPAGGGSPVTPTVANWAYRFQVSRKW